MEFTEGTSMKAGNGRFTVCREPGPSTRKVVVVTPCALMDSVIGVGLPLFFEVVEDKADIDKGPQGFGPRDLPGPDSVPEGSCPSRTHRPTHCGSSFRAK